MYFKGHCELEHSMALMCKGGRLPNDIVCLNRVYIPR